MRNLLNQCFLIVLLLLGANAYGQRQLTGVVRDTEGQTLPGANIVVTGTLVGTTTDFDGRFVVELPAGREEIEVSYVGYTTRRINVQGRSQVEVVLSAAAQQLQEMVVTALGIKRESKALGYSVQQVDAANLQTTNRISPLTGLAGQVAGLQISESGGGAGGSQKILIRGANSLTGSNDPLFVIDGVPVDNSGGSSGGCLVALTMAAPSTTSTSTISSRFRCSKVVRPQPCMVPAGKTVLSSSPQRAVRAKKA